VSLPASKPTVPSPSTSLYRCASITHASGVSPLESEMGPLEVDSCSISFVGTDSTRTQRS
jgi:hypothetical protein